MRVWLTGGGPHFFYHNIHYIQNQICQFSRLTKYLICSKYVLFYLTELL